MVDRDTLLKQMGERLRKRRVEMTLTQNQAAELLEMSLNYYGSVERGKNGLALEKLLLAREKMNLDTTYLLTGEEAKKITIEDIVEKCPKDKQYLMERLICYAVKLSEE